MQLKAGDRFVRSSNAGTITLLRPGIIGGVNCWYYEREDKIQAAASTEDIENRLKKGIWKKIQQVALLEFKRKCN